MNDQDDENLSGAFDYERQRWEAEHKVGSPEWESRMEKSIAFNRELLEWLDGRVKSVPKTEGK